MSDSGKAVFLSYASQDATVVRGIAEALQAGGVEAWFDQSELRGGDAWDQKIRRQIRDCTLFMPVISAATQARGEGYFRREWKLAAERTMDMADGVPFLLPLVLDGVADREALVPDVFRQVQWTRVGPEGLPAAFVGNVRALLEGAGPGSAGPAVAPGARSIRHAPESSLPRWARTAVAITGAAAGLTLALYFVLGKREPPQPAPAAVTPARPHPAPAAAVPVADPRRVALARFENLTGDATLDQVARVLESEITRGLGSLPTVRLLPVEASSRAAARTAAREAGATSVIVGSYVKEGGQLAISAEVVLVAEGELFGTVGPAVAPAADLRGPALGDFIDRLTTGAHNVSVTLQNPPTRISAVTYHRPWPRWSVVTRAQAIRPSDNSPETLNRAVQQYHDLLAEAPEMLKIKHDLARLLMWLGRFDESQKLFRELLGSDRSRLSESELQAVSYDDALLAGDPDRAMSAAQALLEIRPVGDAITQVLACLWAQNRPRGAFVEFDRWWKKYGAQVPEASRLGTELGLVATEALMHLQEGHPELALTVLRRADEIAAGRPFPSAFLLKGAALSALGREADQLALVNEAAGQPSANRVEPLNLQWQGYTLALHHGRPEEARRWLAAAQKSWEEMPAMKREETPMLILGIWLHEAAGRQVEALRAVEAMEARYPDLINVVGARAIVLKAMGRAEEAAASLRRLEQWDPRNARGLPFYWRARLAARAGNRERAVDLLRRAVADGLWFGGFNSPTYDYGRSEPEFATLRGYAPYEQLLKPKG
jgi:tetratricopeptide (TPR) repeat protein/TolB-like protein